MTARLVIPLLVALLASGCAVGKYQTVPQNTPEYYLNLRAGEIASAIAELEKLTAAPSGGTAAEPSADSYYFLALLYSHPDNPAPDYLKAQSALEHYSALVPAEKQRSDTRYLTKLLSEINGKTNALIMMDGEEKKLDADNAQLLKKNTLLRAQVNKLSKENQALKNNLEQLNTRIEQLKTLDLQIEQKKRALH